MNSIELTTSQREQMAQLLDKLNSTRMVAEAFVGYFAKELGVNLQLYQFNADSLTFEPAQGFMPQMAAGNPSYGPPGEQGEPVESYNGKIEAI